MKIKDIHFREKYRQIKEKAQAMDVLDLCRYILFGLMYMAMAAYLVPMALLHPLYYELSKGYYTIGSAKFSFFDIYGFSSANVMWRLIVMYGLFMLIVKLRECRKTKRKPDPGACFKAWIQDISVTDFFVFLYGASLLFSYVVTDYKENAYMGSSGWYMGLMPHLLLVGSYFVITRLLPKKCAGWVLGGMILASVPVYVLGLLNRYGIDPLDICKVGPTYISTIGNINWMCGYWSVVYPLCVGWYWITEKNPVEKQGYFRLKKMILGIAVVTGFLSCVTQGSDSGVMTCGALILLLGSFSMKKKERLKNFLEIILMFCGSIAGLMLVQSILPEQNNLQTSVFSLLVKTPVMLVLGVLVLTVYLAFLRDEYSERIQLMFGRIWKIVVGAVCVTIVSFIVALTANTLKPGCLGALSEHSAFTFDSAWGSNRGGTWTAGIKTWISQNGVHKMFGVGPDCMAPYIYSGQNTDLLDGVRAQFGDSRLTNAHGEWITVLANLGIVGLISFAGMMISAIMRFLKAGRSNVKALFLCAACGLALFCYTVNNTFSFQQIVSIVPLFLVLALGENLLREQKRSKVC